MLMHRLPAPAAVVGRLSLRLPANHRRVWTKLPDMEHGRNGLAAARLPGGRIMVAGGKGGPDDTILDSTEVFDPAAWAAGRPISWASGPPMRTARRFFGMCECQGRLLVRPPPAAAAAAHRCSGLCGHSSPRAREVVCCAESGSRCGGCRLQGGGGGRRGGGRMNQRWRQRSAFCRQ